MRRKIPIIINSYLLCVRICMVFEKAANNFITYRSKWIFFFFFFLFRFVIAILWFCRYCGGQLNTTCPNCLSSIFRFHAHTHSHTRRLTYIIKRGKTTATARMSKWNAFAKHLRPARDLQCKYEMARAILLLHCHLQLICDFFSLLLTILSPSRRRSNRSNEQEKSIRTDK